MIRLLAARDVRSTNPMALLASKKPRGVGLVVGLYLDKTALAEMN